MKQIISETLLFLILSTFLESRDFLGHLDETISVASTAFCFDQFAKHFHFTCIGVNIQKENKKPKQTFSKNTLRWVFVEKQN